MPRYNVNKYDSVNASISLFEHNKIVCKSACLAKSTAQLAQKIITLFKKGNIVDPNSIESEESRVELQNKIKHCIRKLAPVTSAKVLNLIWNKIIPAAYNNRNRAGGYVRITKLLPQNKGYKFKKIIPVLQLEILGEPTIKDGL